MTKYLNIISIAFAISFLFSCSTKQRENNTPTIEEAPEALQDNKLEFKSIGREGDLTQALYVELLDKNPKLKKIEDDLVSLGSDSEDLNNMFAQYDNKSMTYYNSANKKATSISDSVLKTKIIKFIKAHNVKYDYKTAEINSILNQIAKNELTLKDQHTVLKIVLTMPMIEKFQNENKPNCTKLKELLKQQEKLKSQIDGLTPNY